MTKMKLKRGDKVSIIAGKNKGKDGKILVVDAKNNRVIVEGINLMKKHQKPNAANQSGGIIEKEAPIHASNVMYLHKGKPTRIGYKIIEAGKDAKKPTKKVRFAKSTGEIID